MQRILYKASLVIYKKPFFILFCIWLIVQGILLVSLGINTGKEAIKYSEEANFFLNYHHFSEPKYIFYSAYIFLHIVFIKLGFETIGVYLFQLLANLLAMYLLFKTVITISKNTFTAFLSVLLLITCYSWQYWTVFLYTESFFCSLIITFTYFLFGIAERRKHQLIIAGCLLVLLVFARPTGMLFIPVLYFLLLYKLFRERKIIPALIAGAIILFIFFTLLNYAMRGGSSYDFMKPLIENNVLCYIPQQSTTQDASFQKSGNGLEDIVSYITQNPSQFLKLSGLKFLSYWGFTRTYYSSFHNWWLRCFFYPLYFFAIIGIWKLKKTHKNFVIYTTGSLIIFTVSVMFTCDDWNNRFNMPIIPFVILLTAVGIKDRYDKVTGKRDSASVSRLRAA